MSKNRNKRKYNQKGKDIAVQSSNNDTIKIPRTCNAGEINVNNVKYTMESYRDALEKFYNNKAVDIFFGNGNPYEGFDMTRFTQVNAGIPCSIVKIEDDYVEFKISDEDLLHMIKEVIKSDSNKVKVQMRYIGNLIKKETKIKLCDIERIISFDIMIKGEYDYTTYAEYLINKNS